MISIFNVNQQVYDIERGFGEVSKVEKNNDDVSVSVTFKNDIVNYNGLGELISSIGVYKYPKKNRTLFLLEQVDLSETRLMNEEMNDFFEPFEHPIRMTKTLYPGMLVLGKCTSKQEWTVGTFSHYSDGYYHCSDVYYPKKFCIPLKGFEDYAGLIDFPECCIIKK